MVKLETVTYSLGETIPLDGNVSFSNCKPHVSATFSGIETDADIKTAQSTLQRIMMEFKASMGFGHAPEFVLSKAEATSAEYREMVKEAIKSAGQTDAFQGKVEDAAKASATDNGWIGAAPTPQTPSPLPTQQSAPEPQQPPQQSEAPNIVEPDEVTIEDYEETEQDIEEMMREALAD